MLKHFTVTVYICALVDNEVKALLHRHKKHKMWLGIGGHVEINENPIEALNREVKEEAGISVELVTDKKDLIKTENVTQLIAPFSLLEEKISAREGEPAHYHIDFIYCAITNKPQKVKMHEEFGWFSLTELRTLQLEKDVWYNARSAIDICLHFI